MGTRHFKPGLLFMVALVILSFQCRKKETTRPCYMSTPFSFDVTSQWSIQKKIYKVGDTIYLNSSIPTSLLDKNSGKMVDYSNAVGIGGDIGIALLDVSSREILPGKDSFQYVSITGSFLERRFNQNQGINMSYSSNGLLYEFKGAIICRKKGIYGISVDDLKSAGIKGKNCTNAGFKMRVTNSDKNFSLYENSFEIELDQESADKIYCFTVE